MTRVRMASMDHDLTPLPPAKEKTPKREPPTTDDVMRLVKVLAVIMVGFVVGFALTIGVVLSSRATDEKQDDQAQVDVNYIGCLRGNELRVLQIEAEREPSGALDLTILPSVSGAPQWFQDVAREIKEFSELAAQKPIDPNSRTGRRIARFEQQIRDCEAEYPDHTEGLELDHVTTTTETP